jgi:hypothetical protein
MQEDPDCQQLQAVLIDIQRPHGFIIQSGKWLISDHVFMSHGFPVHINAYGDEKIRDTSITQENQLHAKCLTAEAEVRLRAKWDLDIQLKVRQKEVKAQAKDIQKQMEDEQLIKKPCSLAKVEPSEENIGRWELSHFEKMNASELKAFTIARHIEFNQLSHVVHLKRPSGAT